MKSGSIHQEHTTILNFYTLNNTSSKAKVSRTENKYIQITTENFHMLLSANDRTNFSNMNNKFNPIDYMLLLSDCT